MWKINKIEKNIVVVPAYPVPSPASGSGLFGVAFVVRRGETGVVTSVVSSRVDVKIGVDR